MRVTELAASHNMVAEQPSDLTDLIIRFLTSSAEK